MKKRVSGRVTCALMVTVVVLAFSVSVNGQYGSNSNRQADSKMPGQPTMTATLVDAEKKAQQKAAAVKVSVTGIKLIDPALVKELPKAGQGHLHYQVDDGPIIATPTTKLSFHGLTPGMHKILVVLAGNDHNPLGPQQTLTVTIP